MKHVNHANRELGPRRWQRPWSGTNGGNCLEVALLGDGLIALRQSTDPDGPAQIYPAGVFSAFVSAAKDGKADFLLD
ncbi:DUF397 domain-containing protein [Streptomyces sp. NPDC101455]|uniref:DUF397 domain-containing protein n=1 Tax=Streptomyces sp. NPDC101455 TaxID=3366142 RepID=UPI0037FDE766